MVPLFWNNLSTLLPHGQAAWCYSRLLEIFVNPPGRFVTFRVADSW